MYKLGKKEKKQIRALVKGLPAMQSTTEKQAKLVTGSSLLNQGINRVPSGINKGDCILPNKSYITKIPLQINHQTQAEKAYSKKGIQGVEEYVNAIHKRNAEYLAQHNIKLGNK